MTKCLGNFFKQTLFFNIKHLLAIYKNTICQYRNYINHITKQSHKNTKAATYNLRYFKLSFLWSSQHGICKPHHQ